MNIDTPSMNPTENKSDSTLYGSGGHGGRINRGGKSNENEKTNENSTSNSSPQQTSKNSSENNAAIAATDSYNNGGYAQNGNNYHQNGRGRFRGRGAYNNNGQWSNNSFGSWNNNNSSQNKGKAWKCVCCFKTTYHELYGCKTFLSLDQEDRYSHAREAGACLRCLLVGHKVAQCQNTDNCQHCNKPHHHSLLHRHTEETENNEEDNEGSNSLSDYAE